MGFQAAVHIRMRRELLSAEEEESLPSVQNENLSGIFEGSVTVQNGVVSVRYEGPDDYRCALSFAKSDPGILTLAQTFGDPENTLTLVLEEGRRRICINKCGPVQLEITALGTRVRNTVTKNGRLYLSYATELHGFCVEKTTLSLSLHKIEK